MSESRVHVLAQCTNTKREDACPAKDLYAASAYFRAQRAYAEVVGDGWSILSAKHHLVDPESIIAPYDTSMDDVDSEVWGETAARQLNDCLDLTTTEIVVLAGRDYADPLRKGLDRYPVASLREPFDGLRIGKRHQKLNEHVEAAQTASLEAYQ